MSSSDSIGRRFARWAHALSYEDLPEEVREKTRALVLLQLLSGSIGATRPRAIDVALAVEEHEGSDRGSTIVGRGTKAATSGAAGASCAGFMAGELLDSFRMFTHPGPVLLSCGLSIAEVAGRKGRDLITALAAGYEFACRLANEHVPSVSAHGFRPSPIFGTMGAAVTAAKLLDLDEDGMLAAIAIAANCAAGLNEPALSGGAERFLHEVNAARQGVFAATHARTCATVSEKSLEGRAGFLYAYTGSREGRLTYAFCGRRDADLDAITRDLGASYMLLDVMFKIYPTGGFNQPVIELVAELKREHGIEAANVSEVVVTLNELETLYPSPEFPRVQPFEPAAVGSTAYFAAYALVHGRYPVVGAERASVDDASVRTLMSERVTVVGARNQPMLAPSVDIRLQNGITHTGRYPYERSRWSFDELAARLRESAPGVPGGAARVGTIVRTARALDGLDSMQPLYDAVGVTP